MGRFKDNNHSSSLLTELCSLRTSETLTDITLHVGSQTYPCHRNVLVCCSPYFKAMFTGGMSEATKDEITLKGMEETSVGAVLDFMYTGYIELSDSCVQNIFVTSNILQVSSLVHACTEYLERCLDVSNCIGIYQLASTFTCTSLEEAAWDFINYQFCRVIKEEEFMQASEEIIQKICSSTLLNVDQEDLVVSAVKDWFKYDIHGRQNSLSTLSSQIYFDILDDACVKVCKEIGLIPSQEEDLDPLDVSNDMLVGNVKKREKKAPRIGMTKKEMIVMVRREKGEHSLLCLDQDIQFVINLPPVCRALGAKAAVTKDNDIFLATDDFQDKSVFKYNHIRGRWIEVTPRLQGRADFSLLHLDGKLYTLGGLNDWEILNSVECYDPSLDEWQFVSRMPRDVIDFSTATYKDSIFIFSGSRTMSYNTVTDTWTATLPPMLTPRLRTVCITYKSEILVIGGMSATSSTNVPCVQVEAYLPETQEWKRYADLPSLLNFCTGTIYKGEVYLCGMWSGMHEMGISIPVQLNPQYDLYRLDKETDTWVDITVDLPLQEIFGCHTAVLFTKGIV